MKLPQLTLRDLFWLVLVVGMGCAWWMDHRNMKREVERLWWKVAIEQAEAVSTR